MFGYAGLGASHAEDGAIRNYAASLVSSERTSTQHHENCFGWSAQTASSESITVFLNGRPFWSDEPSTPISAASCINAFLREGHEFLARVNGSFAIAMFDHRARELTLAIDRMGIETLAWAIDASRVVFASSAGSVAHRPGSQVQIRSQSIYDYFFFHMVPSPESVFVGVRKLAPGTAVVLSAHRQHEYRYWVPDFSRNSDVGFEELKTDVHRALRSAVQAQYVGAKTGAFLSGGLDSSTVTGYLAQVSAEAANTFSIGFGIDSFDELEYARITNRHFRCTAHEYEVTPEDILRAIPIVARSFDEPFGNSSAIPTYACARYAKDLGMSRLLAGDGGDEIFAGNERYARHKVFEYFNRLPSALRTPVRSAIQKTIDPEHPLTPLRKLRSYVDQASIPMPQRYESWNFVYREGAKVMFRDDFMQAVDVAHPIEHMKEVFESAPSADLLDRMLHYDWKFTLADNDLRKVTRMCAAADIEVAFPMLDNRVVELSARVPSSLKMARLELRTFYKRAMTGFLPDEVLSKQKHGFGLPFGQWLKTNTHLADMVYGSLLDLGQRSIIKQEFLDQLIEDHRRGNPGYYGYVIWDLVILEEWFKHHTR